MATDAAAGDIIALVMTDQDIGDASQVELLFDRIDRPAGQFTAADPIANLHFAPEVQICGLTGIAIGEAIAQVSR